MTPFARLLAAVEAGDRGKVDYYALNALPLENLAVRARDAFSGSTDAAISLCEAMLPSFYWQIMKGAFGFRAAIWHEFSFGDPPIESGNHPNSARALLIAMLRALVAKEGP